MESLIFPITALIAAWVLSALLVKMLIPFLEKKDELILKQISIDIKTNGYIPTKDFIGVDIDAVAKAES